MHKEPCPLCGSVQTDLFHQDQLRRYFICDACGLVFVPSAYFLTAESEKAEYDLHENSPDDVGYRRFLSRTFEPVAAKLAPGSEGLDFGCGPGPTLSVMFEEVNHRVALYDPFYADDPAVFERQYDFITATEVVEHLRRPGEELARLWDCLRPGGLLAIMTKRVIDPQSFSRWHYKADRTHVCFFSVRTFGWLAKQWQATLTLEGKDVVTLEKNL